MGIGSGECVPALSAMAASRATAAALLVLLVTAAPALLTGPPDPPPDPTSAEGCRAAGALCLARPGPGQPACPRWQRPFAGICGPAADCCFIEYWNHALVCGLFGGDCAPVASCGGAPRHRNAFCARPGDTCCIWLY
ncbi:uncharacterized protein LOC122393701 isoform X2 [Amphibalanus amphitrite]|uniref:uncharacterized protein LOC122393701 isoform X2 n=1 Tax=Amphibalanus amphitrite TaxID=1232801 RepID=UPI001C912CB0|nr:uncharacterized protein LOC122393701 isoform X2 [Amphibalanus amphitrite]